MLKIDGATAVIFDWGNTLYDYPLGNEADQLSFLGKFLDEHDDVLSRTPEPAALREFNSERPDHRVTKFAERVRQYLSPDIDAESITELERKLCERIWARGSIAPDAEKLLRATSRAGLKVAIVSNTPWGTDANLWRQELGRHPIVANYCHVTTFCGDCGYRKPDPAPFLLCLDCINTSPSETVVIGDSYHSDIVGAFRVGCPSVWLGGSTAFEQEPAPSIVVPQLSDIFSILSLNKDP